jgi:hypothetical protein
LDPCFEILETDLKVNFMTRLPVIVIGAGPIGMAAAAHLAVAPRLRLSDGSELLASAIVDPSGVWRSPNPLGGNGLAALGEAESRPGVGRRSQGRR